jgi:hypothetical protein
MRLALELTAELIKFPRHLSQHVGGYVLSQTPLLEIVPIGNAAMPDRTFIEWDKDDIDFLRLMKVDVLALGMLTALRRGFDLIAEHYGRRFELDTVPPEDPEVYDMLCKGDSLGVFQVESRAQMSMLPRLQPRVFYDLVVEVAIVRPGPIQGGMVHPYLKRRAERREAQRLGRPHVIDFPHPHPDHGDRDELRRVLHKTLGVPLFQEQAMRIAMEAAKYTPAEANSLRRAMATFRHMGTIGEHEERFTGRMIGRGYDPDFARSCFDQIKGFGEYGFPESHACSFALLVYISSWMKRWYPEVFTAALLNSQPMGFYAPAQLVRDAIEHGAEVRHPDVNVSGWDASLEPRPDQPCALRLGMRSIDGFKKDWALRIEAVREAGPFADLEDLRQRAQLPPSALDRLAEADAFGIAGPDAPARTVGGQGSAARVDRTAVRSHGTGRDRRPPARSPAGAGAVGGGGRRLPDHPSVAEGASRQLPAGPVDGRRRPDGERLSGPAQRRDRLGGRGGAGASAARHGQGRLLHDHRGRDRRGQSGAVARCIRTLPAGGDGRSHGAGAGQGADGRGRDPSGGRSSGGLDADAGPSDTGFGAGIRSHAGARTASARCARAAGVAGLSLRRRQPFR